jgi:peroxiredoxin
MAPPLPPGQPAPDFTLPSTVGDSLSLKDLRGKPVVIAFYPADWSPACGDQMTLYQEGLHLIQERGAQLVGISVDNIWSHRAWAEQKHLAFPLLSDFHPKGAVAAAFGVLRVNGVADRALFVLDKDGVVRFTHVSPSLSVVPGLDVVLEGLHKARG